MRLPVSPPGPASIVPNPYAAARDRSADILHAMHSQRSSRRQLLLRVAVASALSGLPRILTAAPPPDDGLGTWSFEPGLSAYESGPPPRRSTRVFERSGDGVHFLHTGLNAEGSPFRTEYVANYDGREYTVSGSTLYDTVALRLIDRATLDLTFRQSGTVTVTARRVISDQRRRMTITATGRNAQGQSFRNLLVYRRVDGD